eukprot:jgi/Mesen1/2397/ME000157S01531
MGPSLHGPLTPMAVNSDMLRTPVIDGCRTNDLQIQMPEVSSRVASVSAAIAQAGVMLQGNMGPTTPSQTNMGPTTPSLTNMEVSSHVSEAMVTAGKQAQVNGMVISEAVATTVSQVPAENVPHSGRLSDEKGLSLKQQARAQAEAQLKVLVTQVVSTSTHTGVLPQQLSSTAQVDRHSAEGKRNGHGGKGNRRRGKAGRASGSRKRSANVTYSSDEYEDEAARYLSRRQTSRRSLGSSAEDGKEELVSARERSTRRRISSSTYRGSPYCSGTDEEEIVQVLARWRPENARRPDVPDAPVFYPTPEEFKDPIKFIDSIRERAEPYGICRVVPPAGWCPPCPLRADTLAAQTQKLPTRIQQTHKLQVREAMSKKPAAQHPLAQAAQLAPSQLVSTSVSAPGSTPVQLSSGPLASPPAPSPGTLPSVNGNGNGTSFTPAGAPSVENGDEVFGFEVGTPHSIGAFEAYANDFKRRYFRGADEAGLTDGECLQKLRRWEPSVEQIEGEFWRIVEQPTEQIEVLYGQDLEIGKFGSGFPRGAPGHEYSRGSYEGSGWNLLNIARLPGSLLAFEEAEISGVVVPWLYLGMCFSSFCWHVEDHHFYSVNFVHWGAPKVWYGVPGHAAPQLEAAMRKHLPHLFHQHPDLLQYLVTQLSPSILRQEGVPVFRLVQSPREFVITFPRAYHAGFNSGFNCAEAVNVAPASWLLHGQRAVEAYRLQRRKTSVSHDKLLLLAARRAVSFRARSLDTWRSPSAPAQHLAPPPTSEHQRSMDAEEHRAWEELCGSHKALAACVAARVEMEKKRRTSLSLTGLCGFGRMDPEFDAKEEKECAACFYDLHLSAVACACSPGRYACLEHSQQLCACPPAAKSLFFRYSIAEMETLLGALEDRRECLDRWRQMEGALRHQAELVARLREQGRQQQLRQWPGGVLGGTAAKQGGGSFYRQAVAGVKSPPPGTLGPAAAAAAALLPPGRPYQTVQNSEINSWSLQAPMQAHASGPRGAPGAAQDYRGTIGGSNGVTGPARGATLGATPAHSGMPVGQQSAGSVGGGSSKPSSCPHAPASGKHKAAAPRVEVICLSDSEGEVDVEEGAPVAAAEVRAAPPGHLHLTQTQTAAQWSPPPSHSAAAAAATTAASAGGQGAAHTLLGSACAPPVLPPPALRQTALPPLGAQLDGPAGAHEHSTPRQPPAGQPLAAGHALQQPALLGSPQPSPLQQITLAQVVAQADSEVHNCLARSGPSGGEQRAPGAAPLGADLANTPSLLRQAQQPAPPRGVGGGPPDAEATGGSRSDPPAGSGGDYGCAGASAACDAALVKRLFARDVELVQLGRLLLRDGWHDGLSIFPAGFKSRVPYLSAANVEQLPPCYYTCQIIDTGSGGPLFQVAAEDSPAAVYSHGTIDGCWFEVQARVNEAIEAAIRRGPSRVLPPMRAPESISGRVMFGLAQPSICQAVEGLDTKKLCVEYWADKLPPQAPPPAQQHQHHHIGPTPQPPYAPPPAHQQHHRIAPTSEPNGAPLPGACALAPSHPPPPVPQVNVLKESSAPAVFTSKAPGGGDVVEALTQAAPGAAGGRPGAGLCSPSPPPPPPPPPSFPPPHSYPAGAAAAVVSAALAPPPQATTPASGVYAALRELFKLATPHQLDMVERVLLCRADGPDWQDGFGALVDAMAALPED